MKRRVLNELMEDRLRREHAYWAEYSTREDVPESVRDWANTKAKTLEWAFDVLGLEVKP